MRRSGSWSGSSTNPYEYTGRENDGTGLQFNRARYYSPTLQRFVSEDPIGLTAGPNLYAYGLNSPVDLNDPSGLWTGQLGLSGGRTRRRLSLYPQKSLLQPRVAPAHSTVQCRPALASDRGAPSGSQIEASWLSKRPLKRLGATCRNVARKESV